MATSLHKMSVSLWNWLIKEQYHHRIEWWFMGNANDCLILPYLGNIVCIKMNACSYRHSIHGEYRINAWCQLSLKMEFWRRLVGKASKIEFDSNFFGCVWMLWYCIWIPGWSHKKMIVILWNAINSLFSEKH